MILRSLVLCLFLAPLAQAADGPLRDPTRPPDAASLPGAEGDGSLRLDAVLRPVGGKPAAVINGETVQLGTQVQGKRLVAVRETEVVLRGPQGMEILRLAPAVEKTNRPGGTDRSGGKKTRGG